MLKPQTPRASEDARGVSFNKHFYEVPLQARYLSELQPVNCSSLFATFIAF